MRLGRKLAVGIVEEAKVTEVTPIEEPVDTVDTVETPQPERPAPVTADR